MWTVFSLSKSALVIALDLSEWSLLIFGVLLAIGIVGEYAKSAKWKARRRCFEVLVVIGVAGEIFADGGIFAFSRALQSLGDREIGELERRTSDAKERAGKLETEAARLTTENLILQADILRLRIAIADRHLVACR